VVALLLLALLFVLRNAKALGRFKSFASPAIPSMVRFFRDVDLLLYFFDPLLLLVEEEATDPLSDGAMPGGMGAPAGGGYEPWGGGGPGWYIIGG
jgi:hypothetical protein